MLVTPKKTGDQTTISTQKHLGSPQPPRFATAVAGTSVGKTRYFPLRLLWLCRATAKVKPTGYSKKISLN